MIRLNLWSSHGVSCFHVLKEAFKLILLVLWKQRLILYSVIVLMFPLVFGNCLWLISGHTVNYLPPWHERILNLTSYDPLLKAADLWAIACVIISFLVPSDVHGQDVWSKEMIDIKQSCDACQKVPGINLCGDCKKTFLHFVSHACVWFLIAAVWT